MSKKLTLFCMMAITISSASARIINVPAEYTTIQAGIDASSDGDTVLVQPGIYVENIQINTKEIALASRFLLSNNRNDIDSTIIDGDSSGTVIAMSNCGEEMILSGFTITNGYNRDYGAGGINCVNSNAAIFYNIITQNRALWNAAVSCDNSNVRIFGNIITYNSSSFSFMGAGAILCIASSPEIISNVIYGNHANRHPHENGGAINLAQNSSPLIRNNIIWANFPTSIFAVNYSYPSIEYCLLQDNYEGIGNLNLDPLFLDPENGNFNVCEQSPCIDAGDPDLEDPDGSRLDIGIYFSQHEPCPSMNSWFVSNAGDDSSGDGSSAAPFQTIQHGVDVSSHGDTVIVLQGIFHENPVLFNKSIILASNYIFSQDSLDIINTIIDGDSIATTISLVGCDTSTQIKGLTICGGMGQGIEDHTAAGGISCESADATISDNLITNNVAPNYGGGIFARNSIINVQSNIIRGNWGDVGGGIICIFGGAAVAGNIVDGNIGKWNGGISFRYSDSVFIVRNEINSNISTGLSIIGGSDYEVISNIISNNLMPEPRYSDNAGGIYCTEITNCRIEDNRIEGNVAIEKGGGIHIGYGSQIKIAYNTIINNEGHRRGGGLYIYEGEISLNNNVISGNHAAKGGGLHCQTPDYDLLVDNNIFYGNFADTGGAVFALNDSVYCDYNIVASNSIFWNNTAILENEIYSDCPIEITYSDIEGGIEGPSNISVDPIFRDAANSDFHLMSTACGDSIDSPCIDAGRPDILDSLLDCAWGLGASRSDMGAFGGGDYSQVGIEERMPQIPERFILSQNYPNPFNAQTLISYEIPMESGVTIEIFDILGRIVATLVNEKHAAGLHSVIWDANNAASGVYLYKIQAGDFSEIKKCVLMK